MDYSSMSKKPTPSQPQAQKFVQTPASMIPAGVPAVQGQVTAPGTTKCPLLKNRKSIYGFGIAELVMGGLSILLTIIALSITETELTRYWYNNSYQQYRIYTGFTYAAPGLWGGIFVIVTGILAVRVKSDPTRSKYVANMILAIITACVTFSSSFVSGFATGLSHYSPLLINIHFFITMLNFVSMIVTIIHACFCCRGVCCTNHTRSVSNVVYVPAQPNMVYPQQPQYLQGPNSHIMPVSLQHVPTHQHQQQHVPAQQYSQSSISNTVVNTAHQENEMTAETAPPPTYNDVDQDAVQIETKSTAALNA